MKKKSAKVVDFKAYKNKREETKVDKVDRNELLDLIRRIVTTK